MLCDDIGDEEKGTHEAIEVGALFPVAVEKYGGTLRAQDWTKHVQPRLHVGLQAIVTTQVKGVQ